MDGGCVEHVWQLADFAALPDGRLAQTYVCQRCPEEWLVGPDDLPPGETDL